MSPLGPQGLSANYISVASHRYILCIFLMDEDRVSLVTPQATLTLLADMIDEAAIFFQDCLSGDAHFNSPL